MVWTAAIPDDAGTLLEQLNVPLGVAGVEQSVSEDGEDSPVRYLTTTVSPELKPLPVIVRLEPATPWSGDATTESAVVIRPIESPLVNQIAQPDSAESKGCP